MRLAFLERIWEIRWNENAKRVTIFQVVSDGFGNSILNKKVKTLTPDHPDFPVITDGKSLLNASIALVKRFSSKSAEPDTFIGTK